MGDFLRFWWALVSLNARKTVFRARGRRGRPPCQSPSDSGRAWQTQCEEAAVWDKPARFCRVCPHFQRGGDGWRCSVNAADVRPFWGRAALCFGGGVAGFYVAAALIACVYFRAIGYEGIGPLDTVWPARWTRVTRARSEFFLQEARTALQRGDERALRVSLASAALAAKDHYEARLALAQIYSYLAVHQVASSSFKDLLADFPAERRRTAIAYHDALLVAGQFGELGELALAELARESRQDETVWLRALFGTLRRTRRPEELLARETMLARLPATWRAALRMEAKARASGSLDGYSADQVPLQPENVVLLILIGETLAELAPPARAIDGIVRMTPAIGSFERDRLLYRLHARVGAAQAAGQAFDGMLRGAGRPGQRERLLAALVDYPQPDRIERLVGAASNPRAPFTSIELGNLWVAAAASSHAELRRLAELRLRAHYNIELGSRLSPAFTAENAALWVRTLPVSREIVWSLAAKFARPSADSRTAAN